MLDVLNLRIKLTLNLKQTFSVPEFTYYKSINLQKHQLTKPSTYKWAKQAKSNYRATLAKYFMQSNLRTLGMLRTVLSFRNELSSQQRFLLYQECTAISYHPVRIFYSNDKIAVEYSAKTLSQLLTQQKCFCVEILIG